MLSKKSFNFTILTFLFAGLLIFGGACTWQKVTERNSQENDLGQPITDKQQIIGGDKDAGGCLIAAGYSWCEPKQKCLRIWEESCYEADEAAIQKVLAQKYSQTASGFKVTIFKDDGTHAVGNISFPAAKEVVGGGSFLAVKVDNSWQLVYEGNGAVNCEEIKKYDFPQAMLEGYCD